jgi:hypothetical protein
MKKPLTEFVIVKKKVCFPFTDDIVCMDLIMNFLNATTRRKTILEDSQVFSISSRGVVPHDQDVASHLCVFCTGTGSGI